MTGIAHQKNLNELATFTSSAVSMTPTGSNYGIGNSGSDGGGSSSGDYTPAGSGVAVQANVWNAVGCFLFAAWLWAGKL